ncbi:LpxI family protein [Ghiorsea bivora]|uniref:LpxI family protein n=1 Tax=Ghiorsea bivora TaxID=1485545 RepID=UPI00056ED863|nr:UDP-2,3-diacylglucosamine diphosphatase LpxI [Ghiorsea bivora]
MSESQSIGLVAGYGAFPLELCQTLKNKGFMVHVAAIQEEASKDIESIADSVTWVSVGQIKKMIKTMQIHDVSDLIFAGKVQKIHLFRNFKPDLLAAKILFQAKDKKDDSLMLGIVAALEKAGITVRSQIEFADDLLASEGHLFGPKPIEQMLKDIKFGFPQAKAIASLDIGQTIVVKDEAVLAVEAIEGTDEAIKRGGALGKSDVTVVKVSKPNQDPRFDVPAMGIGTLETMAASGCTAIGIEAGKTLLIEKYKLADTASRLGISVIGFQAK